MKKFLVGSYIVIMIGIIVVLFNSNIFNSKDSKAVSAGEQVYKKIVLFVMVILERAREQRLGQQLTINTI